MIKPQALKKVASSQFSKTIDLAPAMNDRRGSVWSTAGDFWTLGGLSILICALLQIANIFRNDVGVVQMRFMQLMAVFSALSIVCNHPHFIISYRLGYGRGISFVLRNWFALLIVPFAMFGFFGAAYLFYDADISDWPAVGVVNGVASSIGLNIEIGKSGRLGPEILGTSIWIMYISVGWHYAKQVYGCMMVNAFYGGYTLKSWQKWLFRWSVLSVAIYQFVYMSNLMHTYSNGAIIQDPRFQGVPIPAWLLPSWASSASIVLVTTFGACAVGVILLIYVKSRRPPSVNFLVPWIAFYVWWIPVSQLPEFYLLMVPFFHSLQYLPFAARMESKKIKKGKWFHFHVTWRTLVLLFVGFAAFELIPSVMDSALETSTFQTAMFFTIAFSIFINIHHFFIDSVVWKLRDSEVRTGLLS